MKLILIYLTLTLSLIACGKNTISEDGRDLEVQGTFNQESGRFPNPSATFDVI